MSQQKTYDNRLGLKGWWTGGRWGIERYLYTLHRLTGLGLVAYLTLHILVTSSRAFGQAAWERWMATVGTPILHVGEYFVVVAFIFHVLNGIRLVLIELGFAVGQAEEPIYPYKTSLNRQRPLVVLVMLAAAVLVVFSGYDFWFAD